MKKEIKYITVLSMFFVFAVIAVNGFRMPWSEEGLLYAVYGAVVGFYLAILLSMLVVWKMFRKHK